MNIISPKEVIKGALVIATTIGGYELEVVFQPCIKTPLEDRLK